MPDQVLSSDWCVNVLTRGFTSVHRRCPSSRTALACGHLHRWCRLERSTGSTTRFQRKEKGVTGPRSRMSIYSHVHEPCNSCSPARRSFRSSGSEFSGCDGTVTRGGRRRTGAPLRAHPRLIRLVLCAVFKGDAVSSGLNVALPRRRAALQEAGRAGKVVSCSPRTVPGL